MYHKKMIIHALQELGKFMSQFVLEIPSKSERVLHNDKFFNGFKHQLQLAQESNGWFSKANLCFAIKQWSELLQQSSLEQWLSQYTISVKSKKTVAIIMAGNIPLVGFHDVLSGLVCGHRLILKPSSNDKHLLPFLVAYIEHIAPEIKGVITWTTEQLKDYDAVIATGSNNTARYFEAYFKDKPSIIRKNRNSVAVLTGKETPEELQGLSEDIFRYYGLGCRSVSKLFVPKAYNFDLFFNAIYHWHPIMNSSKYANNYDYNKAVYLMSEFKLLDNGFLMLKEDTRYTSPIATLFYEYYDTTTHLKQRLTSDQEQIQCVVAQNEFQPTVSFGQTQCPTLFDYADGIDTVDFLLTI